MNTNCIDAAQIVNVWYLILPELQLPVAFYHIFEQDAEHPPMELPLPLLLKALQPGHND